MQYFTFRIESDLKKEFQEIAKNRNEVPSHLIVNWIKHYVEEFKDEEKDLLVTVKRTSKDNVNAVNYRDEYEIKKMRPITLRILKDIIEQSDHKDESILQLEIGSYDIETRDFIYSIKIENIYDTLYYCYKQLNSIVDVVSLKYRGYSFEYQQYLNESVIYFKDGDNLLKDWNKPDVEGILQYLEDIDLGRFITNI